MNKEFVIMFDLESKKVFTLSYDEWELWLILNTDEGFSSAMPYCNFTIREFVNQIMTDETKLNHEGYYYILVAISLARGNNDISEMPKTDEALAELYPRIKALYDKAVNKQTAKHKLIKSIIKPKTHELDRAIAQIVKCISNNGIGHSHSKKSRRKILGLF